MANLLITGSQEHIMSELNLVFGGLVVFYLFVGFFLEIFTFELHILILEMRRGACLVLGYLILPLWESWLIASNLKAKVLQKLKLFPMQEQLL